MRNFRHLRAALVLVAAAAALLQPALAAKTSTHAEIRFLPCPLKEHQIAAGWWSCTARTSLPVYVYGAYEVRVPIFFAHVYLDVPRAIEPPEVSYTDSRHLISFKGTDTFDGPSLAVAAPGYQMLQPAPDSHHQPVSGRTIVSARLSGSIKRTFRFPAIVYQTLRLGCYGFSEGPGASFGSGDRHTVMKTPSESDLYVSGPAGQGAGGNPGPGYGCLTPFADTSGDYVLHFPGGGTILEVPRFDTVPASKWKNELTSISLSDIKHNILLFKTKSGVPVKILLMEVAQGRVGGSFETANQHGVFPY